MALRRWTSGRSWTSRRSLQGTNRGPRRVTNRPHPGRRWRAATGRAAHAPPPAMPPHRHPPPAPATRHPPPLCYHCRSHDTSAARHRSLLLSWASPAFWLPARCATAAWKGWRSASHRDRRAPPHRPSAHGAHAAAD